MLPHNHWRDVDPIVMYPSFFSVPHDGSVSVYLSQKVAALEGFVGSFDGSGVREGSCWCGALDGLCTGVLDGATDGAPDGRADRDTVVGALGTC